MDNMDFSKVFKDKYTEFCNSLDKPHILLCGASGAGKSTLCNLVFGHHIALTGQGRPITSGINYYEHSLLHIYDSAGYEYGEEKQEAFAKLLFEFFEQQEAKQKGIDLIWYCLSAPAARFTEVDAKIIRKIKSLPKPVAVILTQVDVATASQCQALTTAIKEELGNIALFESTTDPSISITNGVEELHSWSLEHLAEARQMAFLATSWRKLELKYKKGLSLIQKRTAMAFGVGFVPIPTSDALLLAPIQLGMLAELTTLWDLFSLEKAVASIGVETLLSQIGKMLTSSLLKMLPVLGSLAGGLVNASVASALTFALGSVFNQTCYKIAKAKVEGKEISLEKFFNSDFIEKVKIFFQEYLKKDGNIKGDILNFLDLNKPK